MAGIFTAFAVLSQPTIRLPSEDQWVSEPNTKPLQSPKQVLRAPKTKIVPLDGDLPESHGVTPANNGATTAPNLHPFKTLALLEDKGNERRGKVKEMPLHELFHL